LLVLVAVLCGGVAQADDISFNWSHTVVAADTAGYGVGGTTNNFDTVASDPYRLDQLPVSAKYVWFTVSITERDTTLLNDTLNVILQWSTNGRDWTFLDSLTINPTSTNDTLVNEATRLSLDSASAGLYANYIRALGVVRYDLVVADSSIIGNTYGQKQSIWVHPRY